ncbi:FACT complex subunit SPT16-like [Nicotiana sylvestris]|uniref:FACT complex subunit n=1 Tax=Nicotiana sylvestris TaxID=4096 RepID=A0A1U7XCH0_NICSY|nr:PREDICTED: FACT complex subunit SPT16-like [Nicotiana sylvestris]
MIPEQFQKRLNAFYINWIQHKKQLWGNSDVVVIHTPPKLAKFCNPKSSSFFLWLLGDDFTDTTVIFTPYGIYFLCTHKSFSKLREFCSCVTLTRKIPTSVQLKDKTDDGFLIIDATIRDARNIRNEKAFLDVDKECPFVVGYVEGEYPKSKLFLNCINKLEPTKYQGATVNFGLDVMFNVADEQSVGPSARLDEKLVSISKENEANQSRKSEEKNILQESCSLMDYDLEHKLQLDDPVNYLSSKLEENKILLEKEKVYIATSTSLMDGTISGDDFTGSLRKDSVVMDHDDDEDWMLIEGKEEGQETNVANKLSWKRWITDKISKSFGLGDKTKIKASSH